MNTPKKSNKIITGLILKTVEILTKKGHKINKNFKTMSISLLSRFCIDENNEILNSACNLIMASVLTNKEEILKNIKFQFSLFSSNLKEISQNQSRYSDLLSKIEVIWIILTGYAYIYTETSPENLEIIFKRIISTIE